jgi:hypothetical protein
MIYIFIRRTTDWENEQVFREQLADGFRPKVETWNSTFTMPYHLFRHRIKEIAQMNLSRVSNSRVAELDEIPEGSLAVPIDDDDWLAPDLDAVLAAELESDKTGYYWERLVLESPPGPIVRAGRYVLYTLPRRERKNWTCTTNNYAVVKSDVMRGPLLWHTVASAYFNEQTSKVRRIARPLSVMNRTLASQTAMAWNRPTVEKRDLITKYHRYRTLYSRFENPKLAWANPYVKSMADLMAELRLK